MAAEMLIKNARIWPSADRDLIEDGSILIRDGRLARVGRFHARAETTIDADGCLVLPGLIQGHIHLCQTLFRGAAEDLPLLPWLSDRIWPLEAAHDEESMRASARLACAEMLRSGTTAFLSMETVRLTNVLFETVAETGMMGVISHCLMDKSCGYEPLTVSLDDSLADCDMILDDWEENEFLRLAVAPRFALSCTPENMEKAAGFARDRELLLHTHASEQVSEIKLLRRRTGMDNIEFLHSVGFTGQDVCLAHCVHPTPREEALLAETGTSVLHCPTANLKLASGVAPVPGFLKAGVNVALGSDGAPCNNRLDLFGEMRVAALVQKPLHGPAALTAAEAFHMATLGGARAMHWEDEMGSLEEGKRANLILVDPNSVHVLPSENAAANLVYAHDASDVVMTIVNGKILFEDGRLTTIDEDKLRAECREQRKKLFQRAGLA